MIRRTLLRSLSIAALLIALVAPAALTQGGYPGRRNEAA